MLHCGINTPLGIATYHFKLEYWDEFPIKELEHTPQYDGYSPDEVLSRIKSLRKKRLFSLPKFKGNGYGNEAAQAMMDYMFTECEIDEIRTGAQYKIQRHS